MEKNIYILDDDEAMRDAMGELFASEQMTVQTFVSAEAFLAWDLWKKPGCAIVDIHMPGMNGLELLTELKARGSKLSVIIVTGQGDVPKAVSALKAGAVDFVEKPFDPKYLVDMVKKILDGDDARNKAQHELDATQVLIDQLSAREREVMEYIVAGNSNKAIAGKIGISSRTVESHRANLMEKMKCSNTSTLVSMVIRLQSRAG